MSTRPATVISAVAACTLDAERAVRTPWQGKATLPSRLGDWTVHVFRGVATSLPASECSIEHVALVFGRVEDASSVPVRIHSECLTSEVFGSLKCDCAEQLEAARERIARHGRGVVLYLRQEGRGIGLSAKIRAYALQELGYDTVDANRALHLPDDARTYGVAADMLHYLRVRSVRLLSNNPAKWEALRELGVQVEDTERVTIDAGPHSHGYLEAKRARMGHVLPAQVLTPTSTPLRQRPR